MFYQVLSLHHDTWFLVGEYNSLSRAKAQARIVTNGVIHVLNKNRICVRSYCWSVASRSYRRSF